MKFLGQLFLEKHDIVKFVILTIVFSASFFAYNKAYSPVVETTYNSASIFSREEKAIQLFGGLKKDQDVPLGSVEEVVNFIISFRPENIQIDNALLEKIRGVMESKKFSEMIRSLHLVIDTERKEPRGQVSGNTLILSGKIITESENIKVLVHELGHIIDIYYLPEYEDGRDISNRFYEISWDDYNVKKKEAKLGDFVSGYALSNKYEDFAESFAFFVFHNDEFFRRSLKNEVLREKYDFLKDYIFANKEFISTNFAIDKIKSYNWDVTKIPVNVKKYLFYIK